VEAHFGESRRGRSSLFFVLRLADQVVAVEARLFSIDSPDPLSAGAYPQGFEATLAGTVSGLLLLAN